MTIHNISESKFFKKNVMNEIGITRIDRRSDRENHQNFYSAEASKVKPSAGVIGSGAGEWF